MSMPMQDMLSSMKLAETLGSRQEERDRPGARHWKKARRKESVSRKVVSAESATLPQKIRTSVKRQGCPPRLAPPSAHGQIFRVTCLTSQQMPRSGTGNYARAERVLPRSGTGNYARAERVLPRSGTGNYHARSACAAPRSGTGNHHARSACCRAAAQELPP